MLRGRKAIDEEQRTTVLMKRIRRADDLNKNTTIESEFHITNTVETSLFIRVHFLLQVERFKNAGPSVHPRDAQPTPKHVSRMHRVTQFC